MIISSEEELQGMQRAAEAVAVTLQKMRSYARPGMSTLELDEYGNSILETLGARSAPSLAYRFPGYTCISLNQEVAHGIPSAQKVLQEGDLVNIDVSAELDNFWADNGGSFVLGQDFHQHSFLVETSKKILRKAIAHIKGGVRIAEIGRIVETEAKKSGFKVIKNLAGHGVGRSLHEEPSEILNYYDAHNHTRFRKNSVIAVETFIATHSTQAHETDDGWTLLGDRGGFVAQHEHTLVVTDGAPIILTAKNGIWD
jgi:methionyl aminopeptidase